MWRRLISDHLEGECMFARCLLTGGCNTRYCLGGVRSGSGLNNDGCCYSARGCSCGAMDVCESASEIGWMGWVGYGG